jgi:hypothetical protein
MHGLYTRQFCTTIQSGLNDPFTMGCNHSVEQAANITRVATKVDQGVLPRAKDLSFVPLLVLG